MNNRGRISRRFAGLARRSGVSRRDRVLWLLAPDEADAGPCRRRDLEAGPSKPLGPLTPTTARGGYPMDCCGHEGHGSGDARFDVKQVADGVHVAVAAPAYKVNSNTA